ncbi:MAG: sigma-54 dependent transcriptional regulator [Myxococcota bacterium]|nr:sigma-54 dependent transcriptional regulator [Myxococcota bacterium]
MSLPLPIVGDPIRLSTRSSVSPASIAHPDARQVTPRSFGGRPDSADAALATMEDRDFDVGLTDLQMPGKDGLELLAALRQLRPATPVVLMAAFESVQTAAEAMRTGTLDYVTRPFEADALLIALERAFERRELEDGNRRLRRAVDRTGSFRELVGKSAAMNEIYALIRKISSSRSNVLITGESGTGKEVVARTIHFTGARAKKPFVPINCTAMPEGLLESELFGHVKGAFTSAHAAKKGLFETAHGGTLFLDEIGDMPVSLQGKLLRVLQDREVRPVGGNQSVKLDVRIIAVTNQKLEDAIQDGRFRKDLYYRLNVLPIRIPPLRERPDDIPVLAEAFLRKHSDDERYRFTEQASRKLMQAPWAGNARELENCIERALALADSHEIHSSDVLVSSEVPRQNDGTLHEMLLRTALEQRLSADELTESYIDAVIEAVHGRKSEAAKMLGMNRRTLYRRAERLRGEGGTERRSALTPCAN